MNIFAVRPGMMFVSSKNLRHMFCTVDIIVSIVNATVSSFKDITSLRIENGVVSMPVRRRHINDEVYHTDYWIHVK